MATSAVRRSARPGPAVDGLGVVIALDDKIVSRRRLHPAEERRGRDRDGDVGLPHAARRGDRARGAGRLVRRDQPAQPRQGRCADAGPRVHPRRHRAVRAVRATLAGRGRGDVRRVPADGRASRPGIRQYRQDVRTKYLAKAKSLPADATFFQQSDSSYPLSWLALDYLFTRFGGTEVGTLYREMAALGYDAGRSGPDHAGTRRHDRSRPVPRAEGRCGCLNRAGSSRVAGLRLTGTRRGIDPK